jgi:hypothetical protein
VRELLKSFPENELAMSIAQIEEISPSVGIPLELIVPQLAEGRVEVEALTVISGITEDAFSHPLGEVAERFPDGKIELPLGEVVHRLPAEILALPKQELQPDVDSEFADPFRELAAPTVLAAVEEEAVTAEEEAIEEIHAAEAVPEPVEEVAEEALVLTEDDRLLLEQGEQEIKVKVGTVVRQFPEGTMAAGVSTEEEKLPETLGVPLELIIPHLAEGEVKVQAKYILAKFPEGSFVIPEAELIRSLPNGEVELPLEEIIPQLPPEVLAAPEQAQQPLPDELPDPFRELRRPEPIEEEAAETLVLVEEVVPPEQPETSPAPVEEEKKPLPSYADALKDPNPLWLSLESAVSLLPEGALRMPLEELSGSLGRDTLVIPRAIVMPQLKEGRVVVPVEILTAQFSSEHFGMSLEQIKARFAEGLVELPLREIVSQVLQEVSERPESQRSEVECGEISSPFQEIPQSRETRESAEAASAAPLAHGESEVVEGKPTEELKAGGREEGHGEAETALEGLVEKCRGLGVSEHLSFGIGDRSVTVLSPRSLNSQTVGFGALEIMAQMHGFCVDFDLGIPSKLVIQSSSGVVVGGVLVPGDPRRLLVVSSLDRSGAGVMSLLFEKAEDSLQRLSELIEEGRLELQATEKQPKLEMERVPVGSDGLPAEVCEGVVEALKDVGVKNCLSVSASDQKLVAMWGEGAYGQKIESGGILDVDMFSRYSSAVGIGKFESALLVTEKTRVTLNGPTSGSQAYLLCMFSSDYGEGLLKAKVGRALRLLRQ